MSADPRPSAIAVLGPTASGKSAFALELAERFDGEIVSVDSALVYRGLDIGAAKPTRAEQARVPHHLIDVREPWQPYSAAEFAIEARRAGICVFAVTVDRESRAYIPYLFGRNGHAVVSKLERLPTALPAIYRALAA